MVKLTDQIWFIGAPNKARFPYCHCLLIDDERRALMDTSCGEENLRKLLKSPIDIIIILISMRITSCATIVSPTLKSGYIPWTLQQSGRCPVSWSITDSLNLTGMLSVRPS